MAVGAKLNESKGVSLHAVAVTDPGGTLQSYQILLLQRGGDLYDESGDIAIQTPRPSAPCSSWSTACSPARSPRSPTCTDPACSRV